MKVTKLVILFNYKKLLLGLFTSIVLFTLATQLNSTGLKLFLKIFSAVIVLNIIASIVASYILYDQSDLFKLKKLKNIVDFNRIKKAILIHASFDPVSTMLEKRYPHLNLTVCDIYGNRHEHDPFITTSKKVFPPNIREVKIVPVTLPFESDSQDVVLAISAVHEVLKHTDRVLFFKEAKRILREGGCIIISEQLRNTTNFLFFNVGAFHFLSLKKWKKAIDEAGLSIDKKINITPFATMLVIRK